MTEMQATNVASSFCFECFTQVYGIWLSMYRVVVPFTWNALALKGLLHQAIFLATCLTILLRCCNTSCPNHCHALKWTCLATIHCSKKRIARRSFQSMLHLLTICATCVTTKLRDKLQEKLPSVTAPWGWSQPVFVSPVNLLHRLQMWSPLLHGHLNCVKF